MSGTSEEVTNYIEKCENETRKYLISILRNFIHQELPNIIETIKWGFPVFVLKNDVLYIKNNKDYVTLGFNNSQKIHTDTHKLQGTGSTMKHIKIYNEKDIDYDLLKIWVKELTNEDT